MNNRGQFEHAKHEWRDCAVWEAMCPEAVDGTLTEAEQRALDQHIAGCAHCAEELAEARRGAAWLHMLKGHTPEPPAGLLERILAETSGADDPVWTPAAPPAEMMPPATVWVSPTAPRGNGWQALWARMTEALGLNSVNSFLQPRLAMTVATAFFSCALSFNLLGLHLRELGSLRPGTISRTVADLSASAERRFENLRVVYQVESRVDALTSDASAADPLPSDNREPSAAQPKSSPNNQPERSNPPQGSSQLLLPSTPGLRPSAHIWREG